MNRCTIVFISFILFSFSLKSQSLVSYTTNGRIIDGTAKIPIEGVTVRLIKEENSTFLDGTTTDKNGIFTLKNIPIGTYQLKFSYIGYSDFTHTIRFISSSKPQLNLGSITLTENSVLLNETTVVGKAVEMVVKEDTLEYNPAAFKMQKGTVVEDLLKRMSGVEIDSEGKITVAGKEVKKIYIDGKQFFGNDPTVASKNIPVDIIDRVLVVDKKSDLSLLTGIDDGEEETIINLTIKKGMKKGWIVNSKGGLGKETEQLKEGELRYEGNALVNRFFGDSQLSFIASTNNVNIKPSRDWGAGNNTQMGMRGGRSSSAGNGVTASDVYGSNFAIALSERFKFGGNLLYNNFRTNASKVSVQNPIIDSIPFNHNTNKSYAKSENFSLQVKMEFNPDSFFTFVFTPNFSYNRSNSNSLSKVYSFRNLAKDSLNRSYSNPFNNSDGYNITGQLDISYKFKTKGRRLSFSFESGINKADGSGLNYSDTYYAVSKKESILDQLILNNSETTNYRFYTTFVEPIGKNNFLQLSYSIRTNRSLSDKYTYKKGLENSYSILDTAYSKSLDNSFINQQIGLSIRSIREKYNYTYGVDLEPSFTKSKRFVGDKVFNNLNGHYVFNVSPNINYTYRFDKERNLKIDYRGKTGQPSISQLDPTIDISNPLKVRQGNPDLLPYYTNNFTLRYSKFARKTQQSFMTSIRGIYKINDIITKSTFDNSGVEHSSYTNETGTWSFQGMLMINAPIGQSKLQINNYTNASYDNKIGYTSTRIESLRNIASTSGIRENFGLTFRNSIIYAQLSGTFNYTKTENTLAINKPQENRSYGSIFIAQINLPFKTTFSSDIRYTANRGLYANLNKSETLWNTEISKLLFKQQEGTISIKAYDILHQQLNISRNATSNYIEDIEYNTLTSYFLVSFAYRFNSMGGRRGEFSDNEYSAEDSKQSNRNRDEHLH
ncbi:MAG: TonB-dependent receptor [Bacteroidales bacterium]|nr:TonB-dependent receptor [Bacteroidales bacterium]